MKKLFVSFLFLSVFTLCHFIANAQNRQNLIRNSPKTKSTPLKFTESSALQSLVNESVRETLAIFKSKNLVSEEVAVTLIDLRNSLNPPMANFRGEAQIYPASVVKMFYMAALHRQLEDGQVKMTAELERGLKNMIIDSGNESTGYILDVLTGTSSGAELPEEEFKKWSYKRNAVNRYYQSLGYKNISINQKTHCEDAWGVEQQFRGYANKNRNMLTTNATARLMAEIALGKSVTAERSQQMMDLMKRNWEKPVKDQFYQEFISHALKPGTNLWSKEGFTSKTRHDTAYVETPEGLKFVLVIYTENHSNEQEIIPAIARNIIQGLGEIKQ
jgi:beta-lactamase class A